MSHWPCDFDFDLGAKNSFLDFVAAGGTVFYKHTLIFMPMSWSGILVVLSVYSVYNMEKLKTFAITFEPCIIQFHVDRNFIFCMHTQII